MPKYLTTTSIRGLLALSTLGMGLTVSAAPFDKPLDLPNLYFTGRYSQPDISPVQTPLLVFTGRQEITLPAVGVSTLTFTGQGDPKGLNPVNVGMLTFVGQRPQKVLDPVTTTTLTFKGKLPK